MTGPVGQPSTDIQAGDKVKRPDADEIGEVVEVLPFYGGFEGSPPALLLKVAVVKWAESRQRTVVRVDDLIKLTGDPE